MDAKFILKIYSVFWIAPVFFLAWVVGKPKASLTNQDARRVLRYLFDFYTARRSFASDLAYLRFDLTFSQLKTESLQYKERKVSKKRKTYFTQQTKYRFLHCSDSEHKRLIKSSKAWRFRMTAGFLLWAGMPNWRSPVLCVKEWGANNALIFVFIF